MRRHVEIEPHPCLMARRGRLPRYARCLARLCATYEVAFSLGMNFEGTNSLEVIVYGRTSAVLSFDIVPRG